jgi:hypothetical protein
VPEVVAEDSAAILLVVLRTEALPVIAFDVSPALAAALDARPWSAT